MVWLAACFYVAVGEALHGVNPFGENKLKLVLMPGVMAVVILGVGLYMGAVNSFFDGAMMAIVAFAGAFVVLNALYWLYSRWEKRNLGTS